MKKIGPNGGGKSRNPQPKLDNCKHYNLICYYIYVTVYEKTRHMGFSMKIEFDAYLISSTIELTHVQVSDRSHASLWSYSAFFVIVPHPQQSRNYGLKALLCMRMAFPYTMCIPEVN